MLNTQPMIVDLNMSDSEYLELLAQGRDPLTEQRDKSYQTILMNCGIPITEAQRIAPLLEKLGCSIEERILVNQALKHIWHRLIGQ